MPKHSSDMYQPDQDPAGTAPLLSGDTFISSGSSIIEKKSFWSSFSEKFNGTVYDGTFTLLAATIGSGVVITPNALSYSGTAWSSIQMVYCCILTYYSLITLVQCADTMKAKSYPELGYKTFGNWGKQAVNICNFFGNWGTIIMYLQLTSQLCAVITEYFGGSHLPKWLIDPDSQIIPIWQATLIILPLSLPREFKPLRYFVFVSFVCVILCCFCIVYEAFDYQPISESFSKAALFTFSGFSTTFPTAVFAYSSQTNTIEVYFELKEPTMKKFKKMLNFTIVFVFIAYAVVGLIGYVPFAANLEVLEDSDYANGIILEAYGYTLQGLPRVYPTLVIVSMLTTCFTVIMTQPFNMRPCRECLRHIVKAIANKFSKPAVPEVEPEAQQEVEGEDDSQETNNFKHFLYVFFPLYTAVGVVLYCESIQMVMNIVGSTFFSLVCFIFPPMFYLKIYKDNISKAQKYGQWFVLISNAIFTVWNTYNNIAAAV